MITETEAPPKFWTTVRILLGAARKRSAGRRKRQRELLNQRTGKQSSTDWDSLGFRLAVLFMAFLNGSAAFVVHSAVEAGQRLTYEAQGKIIVSRHFLDDVKDTRDSFADNPIIVENHIGFLCDSEAESIVREYGGSEKAIAQKLCDAVRNQRTNQFISKGEASPGLKALAFTGPAPLMLGSLVVLWWLVMLVFQGEGLELDIQRRRHPLWEWLFAHPVPQGAVFLAEVLSPMAANPVYWSGPLFAGLVYGMVYDPPAGILAAFLVGVPVTVAAACLGKALEIGVTLRFAPRSRGAIIGLMSWLGYSSMMLFLVGIVLVPRAVHGAAPVIAVVARLPWPWLQLFLGGPWGAAWSSHNLIPAPPGFSFLIGVLTCWLASILVTAAGVWFTVWGAQRGLTGNTSANITPSRRSARSARFGKEPLYRKEFLWFTRDRSAIVQTILIPITVAGFQMFNMRGFLSKAQDEWNYLCGAAILFGTYFLWILGPKSLASEGTALWIALTWPRGLESLLKAKAWLWSLISSGIVALVLAYAIFLFPAETWKILLVGVGWFFFGRSMAEKSVTLVTVPSSSGEQQKISWGRRGAAQLGMLTFSIGILTQQWHVAVMGIVFSWVTAAAMWQNFRARLPFLYDPWSEKIPPPPSLMHAMIAISLLVEGGAVFSAIVLAIAGRQNLAIAQAVGYALCAVVVSMGMTAWLSNHYVLPWSVWNWTDAPHYDPNDLTTELPQQRPWWENWRVREPSFFPHMLLGAGLGILLAFLATQYLALLQHIPAAAELLRKSQQAMDSIPHLRASYAVMAIGFAPFAEEYLFRGLLYRALDREWGGWRAIVFAAGFFAVYHPALAWPPVFLLGVTNCILFKKTGRLAPCVLLHMAYNAVITLH